MPEFDAVVVPGGGVRAGGELPPWVRSRFDRAVDLAEGGYIVALSAGTVHRAPPAGEGGRPIFESAAGAAYLIGRGYPADRVLVETASYDTIGNAYFCRVIHTDPAGWRRLAVVTSEFHMPRTEAIFRWVFGMGGAEPAYRLTFAAVPDEGMSEEVRAARRAKEAASMAGVEALAGRLRTMAELHRWMFAEHGAYAAGRRAAEDGGGCALLESY